MMESKREAQQQGSSDGTQARTEKQNEKSSVRDIGIKSNGINRRGIKILPAQFQTTFDEWAATAKAEQNGTVKFYPESYRTRSFDAYCLIHLCSMSGNCMSVRIFSACGLRLRIVFGDAGQNNRRTVGEFSGETSCPPWPGRCSGEWIEADHYAFRGAKHSPR